MINGHQVQIQSPQFIVNGEEFPSDLLMSLADGISQEFTLRNLEQQGIILRLLTLNIEADKLDIVAFTRIEPSSTLIENNSLAQH